MRFVWEGCSCLGTWDHIVWECSKRPPDHDTPPKPGEMLSSRFGWVLHGQNMVEVHKRHAWLTLVQKTSWTTVHGNFRPPYTGVAWRFGWVSGTKQ